MHARSLEGYQAHMIGAVLEPETPRCGGHEVTTASEGIEIRILVLLAPL